MVNECHLTETALINRICGQKFSCFRKSPQGKDPEDTSFADAVSGVSDDPAGSTTARRLCHTL
jgi:hypothetical protein